MGDVSVHNQFGLVAVEYGAIGLFWLGAFLAALWSIPRPFGIWAASLFTVAGMTTHNLTDGATYALLVTTYAALPAILGGNRSAVPGPVLVGPRPPAPGSGRLPRRPVVGRTRSNLTRTGLMP
jgi:hypothetical protein